MVDDRERTDPKPYNPIEFIQLTPLTKEGIKREALKVLEAESALLKAATLARNIGNATVSLEPEMKALAGGLAFIAKDVGNLFADLLILVSKAPDASRQTSRAVLRTNLSMALSPVRDPVAPLLASYGSAAYTAMLEVLPSADPKSDVQKYLYGPLGEYPRRRGKLIRASLCIAASCAHNGRIADTLNTAVAIEFLHNATLIHDDFEDGAWTRRGDAALHEKYGYELAINAGDALLLLTLRPLLRNFDTLNISLAARLLTEFDWAGWQTVEGQARELGWRHDNRLDTTVADYFTMAMKKTAWLGMILPLRAGALIATGGTVDPNNFVDFGFHLGCLYQIANDIRNLVDPQHHDRSDILEGKRSLILAHVFGRSTLREKDEIDQVLRRPRAERSREDISRIHNLISKYDSIAFAKSSAETMAEAAKQAFAPTFGHLGPSPDKDFLFGLIGYFSSLADAQ